MKLETQFILFKVIILNLQKATADRRRRFAFELLEQRLCFSNTYDLTVIASTDATSEGFRALGRGPSINDAGTVAFVGSKLNNGDGAGNNRQIADNLYSFDSTTNATTELMNRAFMYPNANAHGGQALSQVFGDFGEVQINNAGEVLARRRLNARVSVGLLGEVLTAPFTYLELWDSQLANSLPISQTAMGDGGAGVGGAFLNPINPITSLLYPSAFNYFSDYAGLLRFGSINNNSESAFVGISSASRGGGYELAMSNFDGSERTSLNINPQNPQVMISDLGTIVFRNEVGSILAVATSPKSPGGQFIATAASGFTQVGVPGITDDGSLIVFAGRHTTLGEGVFVSALDAPTGTFAASVKVLGISGDGVLDPGESHNDGNGNGLVEVGEDQGGLQSINLTSRVNANANQFRGNYTLAFLGTNEAGSSVLYSMTVGISPTVSGVDAPVIVAAAGQVLGGVSGTISSLSIYDAVNNHGAVTFWAKTTTGVETIVTAEPPPPSAIVVLTHGFGNSWNTPVGGRFEVIDGFLDNWSGLGQKFRELPLDGSELDNAVETYVSNWNSSDGWFEAFIALGASAVLKYQGLNTLAAIALAQIPDFMREAALNAENAAQRIADDVILGARLDKNSATNPAIQLVGHSRGAAVNARVAAILAKDFQVDEYISLDGYSTDWPFGGDVLSDIQISETLIDADVGNRIGAAVNYTVQDGFGALILRNVYDAINSVGGFFGFGEIFTPSAYQAIDNFVRDWKAPPRLGQGFDRDELIVGANVRSNHVNVTQIYLDEPRDPSDPVGVKKYINDSYVGQHGGHAPAAVGSSGGGASLVDTNPALAAFATPFGFADRDFESSRANLTVGLDPQVMSNIEPLVQLWGQLVGNPQYALSAFWNVVGDSRLEIDAGDAKAELTETDATSISQLVDLQSGYTRIQFGLDVIAPGDGNRLSLQLDGAEFASVSLEGAANTQSLVLPNSLPEFGTITFALVGNGGQTAKIRLDDVAFTGISGDYDRDRDVDQDDHLVWKRQFGKIGEAEADGNRNGVVDAADYVVWRDALGLNGLAHASNVIVPTAYDVEIARFGETLPLPSTGSRAAALAIRELEAEFGESLAPSLRQTFSVPVAAKAGAVSASSATMLEVRSSRHDSAYRQRERSSVFKVANSIGNNLLLLLANGRIARSLRQDFSVVNECQSGYEPDGEIEAQSLVDGPLEQALAEWR